MRKNRIQYIFILSFALFIIVSFIIKYDPGKTVFSSFTAFLFGMIKVLPCAFVLIGLFEVWIKKTTIQKHLSGFKGYIFSFLLASTTVGGIIVALPVSNSLIKKGAKLSVVFTYLFASAVCRIPMTIFEASFLGIKFTLIRLIISLPLIIVFSSLLERYINKKDMIEITES